MASFHPLTEQLQVDISKQRLRFVPSMSSGLYLNGTDDVSLNVQADNPVEERSFDVEVINQSSRFASFEIELSTPGQPPNAANHWYDIEPKVCAKKPPGDRTTFHVVINRAPIPAINTTLDLVVHIFSVEYEDLESTHHLDLSIEQRSHPLQVHLVSPFLKAYPGDRLTIEALAMNLQSEPAAVTLKLLRLPKSWFIPNSSDSSVSNSLVDAEKSDESTPPTVIQQTLPGGDTRRMTFYCCPPISPPTASNTYEFDIEISDRIGNVSTTHGQVEVLPSGVVTFASELRREVIPGKSRDWGDRRSNVARFPLMFQNLSNIPQRLHIHASEIHQHRCAIQPIAPIDFQPDEQQELDLDVRRNRPLLGWERRLLVEVNPELTYPEDGVEIEQVQIKPSAQALEVRVRPIIPLWLQIGGGLLALLLTAWWLWLRPITRHTAPITTVQILGQESTVITGGRDQHVYRWDVRSNFAWFPHAPMLRDRRLPLADSDDLNRAVRVVRQSPKGETQVAIGLENGAIELWDFEQALQIQTIAEQTDRVFALAFSDDAQSLFSGHGSGLVRQWDIRQGEQSEPEQVLNLGSTFSVADLEVLSSGGRSLVAIGGQYNQLFLWDWQRGITYSTEYEWERQFAVEPIIGRYHSLTDVEVSNDGKLLVTADNRGFVTLWDGQKLVECSVSRPRAYFSRNGDSNSTETPPVALPCRSSDVRLSQWQVTNNGISLRTMALTENGCYLATATDAGIIELWTVNPQTGEYSTSSHVHTFSHYSPDEIDIKQLDGDHVLIAVDGPDHRARLYRQAVDAKTNCLLSKGSSGLND